MNRSLLAPLVLSLTVFVFGFGALSVWWYSGSYSDTLPGLFDYPSATWGDGLFLPLFVGALVYATQKLPRPDGYVFRMVAGLLGVLSGAVVVAFWLTDASAQPNWTMPHAHELNAPGWYHAGFLVLAAGSLGWLWADFIQRLRADFRSTVTVLSGRALLTSGPVAVAVGAFLAYAFIAGMDGSAVGATRAGQVSLVALTASLLLFGGSILWAVGSRGWTSTGLTFAVAVPVAIALIAVAVFWLPGLVNFLFMIAAAAFGAAVGLSSSRMSDQAGIRRFSAISPLELVAGLSLYITPTVFATQSSIEEPISLLFLLGAVVGAVVWLLVVRRLRRGVWSLREDYPWVVTSAVFLVTASGAIALSGSPDLSETATGLVFAILGAILAGPAIKVGKSELKKLTIIESTPEYLTNGSRATLEQRPETFRIYCRLITTGIGALCSIIALALLTSYTLGWSNGSANLPASIWSILAVIVSIAGGTTLSRNRYSGSEPRSLPRNSGSKIPPFVSLATCVVLTSTVLLQVIATESYNFWAAIQSLLLALFAGECILSNGLRMGLVQPTVASKLTVVPAVAAIFSAVYWSLTLAIGSSEAIVQVPQSVLGFMVAYVVVFVLTVGATLSIYGANEPKDWTREGRRKGAVQDTLILLPMWLLMGWLPLTIYAHIPSHQNILYGPAIVAQILVGFIALYVGVLTWITGVNNGHVGRTISSMGATVPAHFRDDASHLTRLLALPMRLKAYRWHEEGTDDRERRVRVLSTHTAVQDTLAFAIAAWTVLGFFWLLPTEVESTSARVDE